MYIQKQKITWWLRDKHSFLYILREFTSFFLMLYVFVFIACLAFLSAGETTFSQWLNFINNTGFIVFSIIALLFSLLHTVTWFILAPQAMPMIIAGKRIPNSLITLGYFLAFIVLIVITISAIKWVLA